MFWTISWRHEHWWCYAKCASLQFTHFTSSLVQFLISCSCVHFLHFGFFLHISALCPYAWQLNHCLIWHCGIYLSALYSLLSIITMSSMHALASSGDSVKTTIDCVGAFGLRAFFIKGAILLTLIRFAHSMFAMNSSMFSIRCFGTPCITMPYSVFTIVAPLSISSHFSCLNFVASPLE